MTLLIVVVSLLLYGRTVTFGFDWDDYHFVRPYSATDVARAWTGPWDARDGIEAPFYRPLTIAFFAGRIALFGPRPMTLHALSVVLFGISAGLLAIWLASFDFSTTAILAGTLTFLTHPVMPPSAAVWITNQMHELELLLVIPALILATRDPRHWRWLVVLQASAVLVKEDAVMLAPAVAAIWVVRGVLVPRGWIAASLATVAAYAAVRTWALGGIGGYEGMTSIVGIIYAPLTVVRLAGYVGAADYIAALALTALGGLAAWTMVNAPLRAAQPLLLSAALFGLFSGPLIAGRPLPVRSHLLVVCLAGAVGGAVQLLEGTSRRVWALSLVATFLIAFVVSNWKATNRLGPCSVEVLAHDSTARQWGNRVPVALRDSLAQKACP